MSEIYNLDFINNANPETRLMMIRTIGKLVEQYSSSWNTLVDGYRIMYILSQPITTTYILPDSPKYKFVRLLINLSKAKTLAEAHQIQTSALGSPINLSGITDIELEIIKKLMHA